MLFNDEESLRIYGNEDCIKETFMEEDLYLEFSVVNNFNVSLLDKPYD